jgi:hypothetical protein
MSAGAAHANSGHRTSLEIAFSHNLGQTRKSPARQERPVFRPMRTPGLLPRSARSCRSGVLERLSNLVLDLLHCDGIRWQPNCPSFGILPRDGRIQAPWSPQRSETASRQPSRRDTAAQGSATAVATDNPINGSKARAFIDVPESRGGRIQRSVGRARTFRLAHIPQYGDRVGFAGGVSAPNTIELTNRLDRGGSGLPLNQQMEPVSGTPRPRMAHG